jgi:hypothetical protein
MKNLKKLFILFIAFGLFTLGTVRAEEVVNDGTVEHEVDEGIVVDDEGNTIIENNELIESDGQAEVDGDSFTIDTDSLLDFAIEALPEDTVLADDVDGETYRDTEMVLEDETEKDIEKKEANIIAILLVVVLISAFVVGGIVLLTKKSKPEEVKEEK